MTDKTNYIVTISKTDLAVLPIASFVGNIIVVDSLDKVPSAVETLRASDIIGFDTETRPSFKKGQTYTVSLLQLSTPDTCFLFRLNMIGLPESLRNLLEDKNKLKIGLSLHDDFHNLHKLEEFTPEGFIDLQPFVKDYMIADNSLARIYGILFSQRISKGQRLTNWEAKTLTACQQAYAALDAQACIDIYRYLTAGEFNPWKSPYLQKVEPPVEE
ncbi:MAG: 3'-5' exonuclease domain-containing protein 2 [Muribaculaceae bacterium]|nr:3'-5' exonuclease domain-containing protein 2 [Muribaculaceae bacterium]